MNIETIDLLFTGSKCCFSSLSEDMLASLSILKSLWRDKKIVLAINKARTTVNQSIEKGCMGACQKCRCTVLEILKYLDDVGLDQIFFTLLKERQQLKKTFQLKNETKPLKNQPMNVEC